MADFQRANRSSLSQEDRQKSRQHRLPRLLAVLCAGVYLLSLLPVFAAAFYSHPLVDDFGFSVYVYQTLAAGGGFLDVLAASLAKVRDVYLTWQGTFAAVFVFTLQPGVFSEDLYFLTTFILIGSLTAATWFLLDTLMHRWMGIRRAWSVFTTSCLLFVCVQFVPDKKEAFYWYNGAMYYTFFYALSLVLFALVIRMVLAGEWRRKLSIGIPACLLAFFIGGGNYCTALFAILVLLVGPLAVYIIARTDRAEMDVKAYEQGPQPGSDQRTELIQEQEGRQREKESREKIYQQTAARRETILYLLIPGCLLAALLISMVAPGNSVRGSAMEGMSAVRAVILSVYYAARYASDWTGTAQVALFAGLTPLLYHFAKKVRCSFPYPVLMILSAFLCYAAEYTAPLYAMGYEGTGRQINIYYYTWHLVVIFAIFYLCGWASHRQLLSLEIRRYTEPRCLAVMGAVLAALFISGCASYGFHSLTSVDTAAAVLDGTCQAYDAEYREIVGQIQAGESYVKDIQTIPDFFGSLDLSTDDAGYSNLRMSEYYGVEYFYRESGN